MLKADSSASMSLNLVSGFHKKTVSCIEQDLNNHSSLLTHFSGALFLITLSTCLTKINKGKKAWKQEDKTQDG